ncbi:hypothetical protein PVAP13_2NG079892 [Panicum virgatum]|uniref:Uncharacterized protein n=1 Tax=Panicum virgatum TaxID=38727 RepID=A0A8T0VKY4_PANVG|nr:hypothetical protein PVAP13_2NG079892 [Panicum virgatum]
MGEVSLSLRTRGAPPLLATPGAPPLPSSLPGHCAPPLLPPRPLRPSPPPSPQPRSCAVWTGLAAANSRRRRGGRTAGLARSAGATASRLRPSRGERGPASALWASARGRRCGSVSLLSLSPSLSVWWRAAGRRAAALSGGLDGRRRGWADLAAWSSAPRGDGGAGQIRWPRAPPVAAAAGSGSLDVRLWRWWHPPRASPRRRQLLQAQRRRTSGGGWRGAEGLRADFY